MERQGSPAVLTQKRPQRSRSATIVGILFIVATVFFVVGEAIYKPILDAPSYLESAADARTTIMTGMLIGLAGTLAITLIPAFMFPVFGRGNE